MNVPVDLSGAVLSVTWRAAGSHEMLAVFPDRVAWYWALVPSDAAHADVAGSFRATVGEGEWGAVEEVAGRVVAAGGEPRPGELGLSLTARGRAAWTPAGSALAGAVGAVALPLVERARAEPVAVARLLVQVVAAPTGQGVAAYRLQSIGSAPVVVKLDPGAFQLAWPDGAWEELAPPHIGLVDAEVNLLDGIYRPASIPAGGVGVLTIPVAEDRPPAPASGSIGGDIVLAGPWRPEAAYEGRFRVTGRAMPLDLVPGR